MCVTSRMFVKRKGEAHPASLPAPCSPMIPDSSWAEPSPRQAAPCRSTTRIAPSSASSAAARAATGDGPQDRVNAAVCLRISFEPSQIIRSATKVMIPSPTHEIQ
jgi:hypothetical protein